MPWLHLSFEIRISVLLYQIVDFQSLLVVMGDGRVAKTIRWQFDDDGLRSCTAIFVTSLPSSPLILPVLVPLTSAIRSASNSKSSPPSNWTRNGKCCCGSGSAALLELQLIMTTQSIICDFLIESIRRLLLDLQSSIRSKILSKMRKQ